MKCRRVEEIQLRAAPTLKGDGLDREDPVEPLAGRGGLLGATPRRGKKDAVDEGVSAGMPWRLRARRARYGFALRTDFDDWRGRREEGEGTPIVDGS